jgi:hypothetical protein
VEGDVKFMKRFKGGRGGQQAVQVWEALKYRLYVNIIYIHLSYDALIRNMKPQSWIRSVEDNRVVEIAVLGSVV